MDTQRGPRVSPDSVHRAQFPSTQTFSPKDWNQGMTAYPLEAVST